MSDESDEVEIDPLVAVFAEASKIYDQFIADNKRLDQAIRNGEVSVWVHLARSRLIGDFSDPHGRTGEKGGVH